MTEVSYKIMQVDIILFDDCDLLDTGGPYEVFLTASRLAEREGSNRPFNVNMVTLSGEPVTAYGGLGLMPTAPPDTLTRADVIIVPGAVNLDAALANKELEQVLIQAVSRSKENNSTIVASVCTGAFLLAAAGALDDKPWTTHWEDIELLSQSMPQGAQRGVRWVDNGNIVTGGALSSGIAMSLHLVERLAGKELAEKTATQLDYDWNNISLVS